MDMETIGAKMNANGLNRLQNFEKTNLSDLNNQKNKGKNNEQMSPFGNVDAFDFSPEANSAFNFAKAQFTVSYQAIKSISGPDGNSYQEVNFSFSASLEFMQVARGDDDSIKTDKPEQSDFIEKMKDLFSPEKTAERILDFALSQYAPQGEGGEGDRQAFADFIGSAIQDGFNQAQSILGKLNDSIQEGVDKTHKLVFDKLNDFVKNGVSEDLKERSKSIREYAAQFKASVKIEYSSITAYSYNSTGQLENTDGHTTSPFEISA